ncbi:MAG: peptide chain release factor N(5)-glutamine methyltransferase [Candidatus Omnitrophica bacterium]|nr:peptide chain release factor N(5)-glutamine methyltransferase [Candidatus Omnitrophota bacterium]
MNETELLFTQVLNCQRASLYLDKDKQLSDSQISFIASVLKRRIKGEPIQYILGRTEFMGLEFKVDKDVLIPRPETEILLETAIGTVRKFASSQVRKLKALDIGTGSGCIAVALAKEFPGLKIDATDVSLEALKMAQGNAKLNGVKINFIQSDLFTFLGPKNFDGSTSLTILILL